MIFTQNSIGRVLSQSLLTAIDISKQQEKKCNTDMLVSVTQILYAMKAYKIDTGRLLVNLTDLVPKYVKSLPEDPYDGKPMKYNPGKNILYSVGVDGADQGGSEGADWTKMPNPTFTIGF